MNLPYLVFGKAKGMTDQEWSRILECVSGRAPERVSAGLIVDSPWIPGYCGADTVDYYSDAGLWLACQDRLRRDFPGLLFLPGDWVEFGMAAEPSATSSPPPRSWRSWTGSRCRIPGGTG